MLSTRRMEHGAPLLVDFDLGALLGAREKFMAQDPSGITDFIRILSASGKAHTVRRLSALVRATDEQLRQAEADPAAMDALEEEAAQRPFSESYQDAMGFFVEWGSSFGLAPSSSSPESPATEPLATPAASPSDAS